LKKELKKIKNEVFGFVEKELKLVADRKKLKPSA
jgi:hypothetical protein